MQYKKGESLEARVKTVRRLSRWATTAIRSWKLIYTHEDSDQLAPYHPYLVVSAHGHRELGLLYLNAVFEKRPDTVNISSLISHLHEHGIDVSELKTDLASHAATIKKLYQLRSAAIGHRTGAQSYDQTFDRVRMTVSELEELLELASRCGEWLARVVGLPTEDEFADPLEYLAKMLRTLTQAEIEKARQPYGHIFTQS